MSTWGGSATLIRSLLILGIARSNFKVGTWAAGTRVSADVVPRGLSGGCVGVWTQGILVLTATYLLVGQPYVNKPCTNSTSSLREHMSAGTGPNRQLWCPRSWSLSCCSTLSPIPHVNAHPMCETWFCTVPKWNEHGSLESRVGFSVFDRITCLLAVL